MAERRYPALREYDEDTQPAAAINTVRARSGPPGIALTPRRIRTFPVPAPLPHVPAHVIEAHKIVGGLPSHIGWVLSITAVIFVNFVVYVSVIPGHFSGTVPSRIFIAIGGIPPTGRILPFGLRGQAIAVCAPVCTCHVLIRLSRKCTPVSGLLSHFACYSTSAASYQLTSSTGRVVLSKLTPNIAPRSGGYCPG